MLFRKLLAQAELRKTMFNEWEERNF